MIIIIIQLLEYVIPTPPPQHTCSPPLTQSLLTPPHAPDEFDQSLQTLLRLISKPIAVILEHHLLAVSQESLHTWAQNNCTKCKYT